MEDIIFFKTVHSFILNNQSISYLIISLTTLLESTLFVGLLIPAGLLMIVFGLIAYGGNLDIWYVLLSAIFGAFIGDVLNYFIGSYNSKKHTIKTEKIASNKKNYLKKSQSFFNKHGGKSVLFGRFIGITRPFIGFIAGGSLMPVFKFSFFSFIGASLWVSFYLSIGYIFGSSISTFTKWIQRAEDTLILLTLTIITYLYLKNIYKQKFQSKVLDKSDRILEKIEHINKDLKK